MPSGPDTRLIPIDPQGPKPHPPQHLRLFAQAAAEVDNRPSCREREEVVQDLLDDRIEVELIEIRAERRGTQAVDPCRRCRVDWLETRLSCELSRHELGSAHLTLPA